MSKHSPSRQAIIDAEAHFRLLAARLKDVEVEEAQAASAVEAARMALKQRFEVLNACEKDRHALADAKHIAHQTVDKARRAAQPTEPAEGSIIKFDTPEADRERPYAAIRIDGRWYATGQTGPANGYSWDDVMAQAIEGSYLVVYRGES